MVDSTIETRMVAISTGPLPNKRCLRPQSTRHALLWHGTSLLPAEYSFKALALPASARTCTLIEAHTSDLLDLEVYVPTLNGSPSAAPSYRRTCSPHSANVSAIEQGPDSSSSVRRAGLSQELLISWDGAGTRHGRAVRHGLEAARRPHRCGDAAAVRTGFNPVVMPGGT